ncbi:hypothetical protein [Roseateles cavernae]|uniref:hypothetical protein n=1 Tax=Roseateles cavernae TaxID=3153578 RepID=UPI0032E3C4AB
MPPIAAQRTPWGPRLCLLGALLMQACGGGGGGDTTAPTPTPPIATARLQLDGGALRSETERGDPGALLEKALSLQVSGQAAQDAIYFSAQADGEAVETIAPIDWNPQTGRADVRLRLRSDLPPARYAGRLTLNACHDRACQRHLSGSPSTVEYEHRIHPAFQLSTHEIEFNGSVGERPAPSVVTISLPAQASGWTYQILNSSASAAWLEHRMNGAQLELQPVAGLKAGVHKAEIQFQPQGVDRPPRTLQVKATIEDLVRVLYVPSFAVHTLGTQAATSIRVLRTSLTPADLTWSAHSDTPWLRLVNSQGGLGNPVVWAPVPEAFEKLANQATHEAAIELKFSHGLPARRIAFRLIKRLAQLDSVDDSALQAGRPGRLILHGTGLDALRNNLAQLLSFEGGASPVALQWLDNGRIQVELPAQAAGRYEIRLGTMSGLPGQRIAYSVHQAP